MRLVTQVSARSPPHPASRSLPVQKRDWKDANRDSRIRPREDRDHVWQRTFRQPELRELLPKLHRLLRSQTIREYEQLLLGIDAYTLVERLDTRCKLEGVARVMAEACPASGTGGVFDEVL